MRINPARLDASGLEAWQMAGGKRVIAGKAYAFGELLVLALYARFLTEGPPFVDRYLDLLRAGGSRTPQELLAPFAIDLNDPAFWHGGLDIVELMLAEVLV